MFRLKANKTSLYKLVGEFEDLPPMRRVTITKAYRTPDWWLKWTDADGLLCVAFFSTCMGKALSVDGQANTTTDGKGWQLWRAFSRYLIGGTA